MEELRKFEGWATVELMGHGLEAGLVTTIYFGSVAMFQIDSPALPNEIEVLAEGAYTDRPCRWVPKGSKVERTAVPAKSRIVSTAAIFAINPCSEEETKQTIRAQRGSGFVVLEEAPQKEEAYPF